MEEDRPELRGLSAPAEAAPGRLFALAAWLYLLLAVAGLLWIGRRDGTIPLALFLPPAQPWLDLLAGLGAACVLLGGWELARRRLPLAAVFEARLRAALGPLPAAEAYGLALLSGLGEEVLFRGAMQPSWGWLPTTLLFGLLHSGRGREMLLWTAGALLAGGLLAALMEWRGCLLAPVVCHVLVNAVQLRRIAGSPPPSPAPG